MSTDADRYAEEFLVAWNAHDADAAVECMTEDCVWEFTVGTDRWGTSYQGKAAIRDAFNDAVAQIPDLHYDLVRTHSGPDRNVMEVRVTGTPLVGDPIDYQACDILEFSADGLVAAKRSYRKVVTG